MPRSRVIKPEFWSDEKIGSLSFMQRLLFIGMWTFADDEGIVKSHPAYLKSNVFPYDDIKISDIEESLEKFKSLNMILKYVRNQQNFLWIVKFRVYQRIDKPQKSLQYPPNWKNQEFRKMIFYRDNFTCHMCKKQVFEDGPQGWKNNPYTNDIHFDSGLIASIDHIIPRSNGGHDFPSNLLTSCCHCNKGRGNRSIESYCKILGTLQEDSENIPGTVLDETETETEVKQSLIQTETNHDGFDSFWKAYPKKIGKQEALKAWKRQSRTRPPIETILSKIEILKKSDQWQKENGQFIPHPATWLNRGSWDDEVVVETEYKMPGWEGDQ